MDLNKAKRKLGSVLLYEMMGTAILVACVNMMELENRIAPIAFTYFSAVILTVKISGAQLNPALTWAVFLTQDINK